MDEVWIYVDRREIIAFSSKEKLMQWAQDVNPGMKSLRLMSVSDKSYTLLNHNTHLFPYNHRIYRLDLDTGRETFLRY